MTLPCTLLLGGEHSPLQVDCKRTWGTFGTSNSSQLYGWIQAGHITRTNRKSVTLFQNIPADTKSQKTVREEGGDSSCSQLKPSTSAAETSAWLSPHRPTTCPFWAWVSSAVSCNCLMIFRFCVLEKHSRKSERYWSNIALSKSNESLRKTWYVKGLLNVRSNWYFLCLKTHLFLPFTLVGLIKNSLP